MVEIRRRNHALLCSLQRFMIADAHAAQGPSGLVQKRKPLLGKYMQFVYRRLIVGAPNELVAFPVAR